MEFRCGNVKLLRELPLQIPVNLILAIRQLIAISSYSIIEGYYQLQTLNHAFLRSQIVKCNNEYDGNSQGPECIHSNEKCFLCFPLKEQHYKPAFVTCRDKDHGLLLAVHYFFSVPQSENDIPQLCKNLLE
jgi:hypothetical protein